MSDDPTNTNPPPKSIVRVTIHIGVESHEHVQAFLKNELIEMALNGGRIRGHVGGAGGVTVSERTDITPEEYREQLSTWLDRERERKRGRGAA